MKPKGEIVCLYVKLCRCVLASLDDVLCIHRFVHPPFHPTVQQSFGLSVTHFIQDRKNACLDFGREEEGERVV